MKEHLKKEKEREKNEQCDKDVNQCFPAFDLSPYQVLISNM